MGVQAAPAVQAVPEGAESGVMDNPLWMLVPWAVFALAAGLKFWRLTSSFRKHLLSTPSGTERFRQGLERMWTKGQHTP